MSKKTVLEFLSAETTEEAHRALYKSTDCGAWIKFHEWGIELGSIVEGANFGTAVYPLRYADGFTSADIQARIDAIEAEADAIWKWANEGPEGSDETWADTGLDAPDVDREYLQLNPEGRSS
jgi:hypothetical protein